MTDAGTSTADAGDDAASVVFREGAAGHPPGFRTLVGLAAREYRVVSRSRWVLGLTVLFAAFSAGVVAFGAASVGPSRYGAVVASLAELSVYLVPLSALALGYGTVVGAAERGTLPMLFSLPVSRFRTVVGMFLGRVVALWTALAIGLGVGGLALLSTAGPAGWNTYLVYVVATVLTGSAFLSVGVLVSTLATEKDRALGGVLLAWAWFVLVHDLLALGAVVSLELPDAALSALVLANPADLCRALALSAVSETAGGFGGALATTASSPPLALAGLVVWTVVPVVVAGRVVRRRRI